jgi:hypothetical protein
MMCNAVKSIQHGIMNEGRRSENVLRRTIESVVFLDGSRRRAGAHGHAPLQATLLSGGGVGERK